MTVKDGPTKRILHVLDLLLRNGPMTLAEVARNCSFSRAAAWRALDTLRDAGWVRMRLGDNAFVILAKRSTPSSERPVDFQGASEIATHMQALEREYGAHICVGAFIDGTKFTILESTDRTEYALRNISLVHEGLTLVAQAVLSKIDLVRILRAYAQTCPLAERHMIEDGRHAAQLSDIRNQGYFLSDDHGEIAFALRLHGHMIALKIRSKTESPLAARQLIHWRNTNFP
ncbi:helix-turn-helix domain-containing protein [Rhodobacterales bacterium LSUCC0031]|nr:helix-turn-helix domain-containing protein [Rhodobacterales bacterium LSUCC0031]